MSKNLTDRPTNGKPWTTGIVLGIATALVLCLTLILIQRKSSDLVLSVQKPDRFTLHVDLVRLSEQDWKGIGLPPMRLSDPVTHSLDEKLRAEILVRQNGPNPNRTKSSGQQSDRLYTTIDNGSRLECHLGAPSPWQSVYCSIEPTLSLDRQYVTVKVVSQWPRTSDGNTKLEYAEKKTAITVTRGSGFLLNGMEDGAALLVMADLDH